MHKLTEVLIYALATIGFACVVKHIRVMHCEEGCCMCGWHKTKAEDEKRTGSRYGSNPVKY